MSRFLSFISFWRFFFHLCYMFEGFLYLLRFLAVLVGISLVSLVKLYLFYRYVPGNGFHVIAAHTDSPCLKLKPKSSSKKCNCLMVNVQTYGGGLWHTWFDRDLSVAGRVIVRGSDGSYLHKLVKVRRPLLRIPTLAIHLDRFVPCCFLYYLISFMVDLLKHNLIIL